MDVLALLIEHLPDEHPIRAVLERLEDSNEEDPLDALGALALARCEGRSPSTHVVVLEPDGKRITLSEEDLDEIANALRTKERLVRGGFYDETVDGDDIASWAARLEKLVEQFR
ncbi:MAG: hypothetical protein VX475_06780 [Myxococcota bacterium]|nr:hypothetical protein [Myxococcota bacterium]